MEDKIVNLYDENNASNVLLDFIKDKSRSNKSLDWQKKSKGEFYTHPIIVERLISDVIKHLKSMTNKNKISIVDPFCGDGRLITEFLKEVSVLEEFKGKVFEVYCWDIDNESVEIAIEKLKEVAISHNVTVVINGAVCDSFSYTENHRQQFDICLTNPPWLIVKPSKKEKESLSSEEQLNYIMALKDLDNFLSRHYPLSMPSKKFAGWGTNLARSGTELALTLIHAKGICGIVSPASLIGDQVSTKLRKWVFEEFCVSKISYYVAEAKLFGKVDQDVITLTITNEQEKKVIPTLIRYNKELQPSIYNLTPKQWQQIKAEDYIIPIQFGFQIIEMNKLFSGLNKMSDLELNNSIWMGREIDETKIDSKLTDHGKHLFIKGRMINRYSLAIKPNKYLDNDKFKNLPKSINYNRVIWRDVARMSQKRRMVATIIPPNYVVGNSAHVIYSKQGNSQFLKAILAIMNSLIFEAQVRASSATNHISLGIVRNTKIPPIDESQTKKLAEMIENIVENEVKLEVYIALLYKLSYNQFVSILTMFDKLSSEEKNFLEQEALKYLEKEVTYIDTESCVTKS